MQLRDRRRAQTRREIVDTARDLFLHSGFESVSVDTIAARCGISRATFFNYFPSKEHILCELLAARLDRVREKLATLEQTTHASIHDVTEMFVAFGAENESLGDTARQVLLAMLTKPACREVQAQLREACLDVLTRFLARTGELPNRAEPALVAETIFTIYLGSTVDWMLSQNPPEGWLADSLRARFRVLSGGAA